MFTLSTDAQQVVDAVEDFFQTKILPNHHRWLSEAAESEEPSVETELREEAKSLGLWNLALPRLADDEPGTRLTNLEFTGVAEILGRLPWASRVFNSHAPDTPNMELLQLFGTAYQKETFLNPLLEGDCGSCFSMTEPETASSDPANLATTINKDGDNYVINGRKWFSSNGSLAKTRFSVLVGVTDPDAPKSQRQSLILVPLNSPGVDVERDDGQQPISRSNNRSQPSQSSRRDIRPGRRTRSSRRSVVDHGQILDGFPRRLAAGPFQGLVGAIIYAKCNSCYS